MGEAVDLLAHRRALVIAPAGCGKTQLLVETISRHEESAPVLVLTHTNSGVAALRDRLRKARVPPRRYRLSTLHGWALRLATTFPIRSGYGAAVPAEPDYGAILKAAHGLLAGGHISDLITATYGRVLVDEYQDCSVAQHAIVCQLADLLPTAVVGDHMQAIFDLASNDPLAHWDDHVCGTFPLVGQLDTPHRWVNAKAAELGEWLLWVRGALEEKRPIDLACLPRGASWTALDGTSGDFNRIREAAQRPGRDKDDRVLVIGMSQSPGTQRYIARTVPGATVVENVDVKDLVDFARDLDLGAPDLIEQLVEFAAMSITGVKALKLPDRVRTLTAGKARKGATSVELAALRVNSERNLEAIAELFESIHGVADARVYRPVLLWGCLRAIETCTGPGGGSFHDAAVAVRERNRHAGRRIPNRGVGSTLLLKGLEAEAAVILNADRLTMRHLYVAMTRGSKALTLCSRSQWLNPEA